MVTRAQLVELQTGNAQITRLMERDLRQVWGNLPLSDRDRARNQLLRITPTLVDKYGQISASLSAGFFDDVVRAAPVVAGTLNTEAVAASTRWAIGPLWDDNAPMALSNLAGSMQKHTLQFGRDTLHQSTVNTRGVTYARVPGGNDTCAFCTMLASRGAVYGSEDSAGGAGNDFHERCGCEIVPVRDESELPPGYDPDALYEQYQELQNEGKI